MTDDVRDLWPTLVGRREQADVMLAAYDAAGQGVRSRVTLAEYRCKRRCDLLTVWQSPHGAIARLSPYKLSEAVNEAESSPAGRAANTTDGNRRWKAAAVFLDDHPDDVPLPLNCDHVRTHISVRHLLTDIADRTPGQPSRRVFPL